MTTSTRDAQGSTVDEDSSRPVLVVGASRGLGRGIAVAFARTSAPVVAVARSAEALRELARTNPAVRAEVADATDPTVPGVLLDRHQPGTLIIAAGASPLMRPLHQHTWETFSVNWQTDVRIAFHWLREALLTPMPPGSRVLVISSGAAVNGSPLSGGYAGAKATQRFLTAYARDEAQRAGLDISFTAVLPQLTPATDLGLPAVRAYASRSGQSVEDYLVPFGEPLTPEIAGAALRQLARTEPADLAAAYLLTGAGLRVLP